MNKGTYLMVAILAVASMVSFVGRAISDLPWGGGRHSGTPGIPSGGHGRRTRHAPNDGRWHMKYHRNRKR